MNVKMKEIYKQEIKRVNGEKKRVTRRKNGNKEWNEGNKEEIKERKYKAIKGIAKRGI